MSIVLVGSTSGSITLQEPAVAGSTTINLPATSGTVLVAPTALTVPNTTGTVMVSGNMPAFSAYASSNQTVSSAADTKITLDTELFDTNSNFASSRFTPTVSGYYQISATIKMTCSGNLRRNDIELFKNGSLYQVGSSIDVGASSTGVVFIQSTISTVMFFNGSTDYVELYVFPQANSGTLTVAGGSDKTWMSGCLVRAA